MYLHVQSALETGSNRAALFKAGGMPLLAALLAVCKVTRVTPGFACRPQWDGSLNKLLTVNVATVQSLVGAHEPFEYFIRVSGADVTDRARARIRA
jgi:hypothetical protein